MRKIIFFMFAFMFLLISCPSSTIEESRPSAYRKKVFNPDSMAKKSEPSKPFSPPLPVP